MFRFGKLLAKLVVGFILLSLATLFVTISVCWPLIEEPLMRALGGQ